MNNNVEKILISKKEIIRKNKELAFNINIDYKNKKPLIVCILKGAFLFASDLIKQLNIYLEIDFMYISSYDNNFKTTGKIKILKDIRTNVKNRHILIVEDIIDSGNTIFYLKNLFKIRKAKSIKVISLLNKPDGRIIDVLIDYIGFNISNKFVVGYGLDYFQFYRNLPYIGILKNKKHKNFLNI